MADQLSGAGGEDRRGVQLADNLIGQATEQSLLNANQLQHSCLQNDMGPSWINLNLLNTAVSDSIRERNKDKAPLIITKSNYDLPSTVIKVSATPEQLPISKLSTTIPYYILP